MIELHIFQLNRLSYDICMGKQVSWVDEFLIYFNGSTFSSSTAARSDSLKVSKTSDNITAQLH